MAERDEQKSVLKLDTECINQHGDAVLRGEATVLFTSLTHGGEDLETTDALVSSLMDTWVLLTAEETERRRRRWLYVLKSRGTAHSNEVREYRISDHGVEILPSVSAKGAPGTRSA